MEKEKQIKSRFNNEKKDKRLSIHERWAEDSDSLTIKCSDGKRRTLDEIVKLEEQGIKIID